MATQKYECFCESYLPLLSTIVSLTYFLMYVAISLLFCLQFLSCSKYNGLVFFCSLHFQNGRELHVAKIAGMPVRTNMIVSNSEWTSWLHRISSPTSSVHFIEDRFNAVINEKVLAVGNLFHAGCMQSNICLQKRNLHDPFQTNSLCYFTNWKKHI